MSPRPAADIRAITLDVGDTLIQVAPSVGEVYSEVCRSHGVALDPDRCNQAFEEAWRRRSVEAIPGKERFASAQRGEEGYWEDLVGDVMVACGIQRGSIPPISAFREAFAAPSSWRIYDEVPAALETLSRKGYQLAVLSNWDSRLPALLERLRLDHHFSHIFVSALAGIEKPHRDFFRMAVDTLGAEPRHILHIGDRIREDYRGAREAGMQALWLDRRGNGDAATGRVDPEHVIEDLSGVVRWLAAA